MGLKIVFKKGFDKMNNDINKIVQKNELYDKCENMEELYDKYYVPLLEFHYKKISVLEQALDEIEKILRQPQFEYDNIPCNYEDDIEKTKEIIQKAKGDVKNEN